MTGLVVSEPGPSLLIQDLGRPGYAHLGVPPSGALDPAALSLANRLVGNEGHAAGLETLLGSATLVAGEALRCAVTGARVPVWIDGRPAPWGAPLSVRGGQRITLGRPETGLRSWVALSGGVGVPPVLGSRSTDTFTGLGPGPLRSGDRLPLGGSPADPADVEALGRAGPRNALRIHPGPRGQWLEAAAWDTLTGSAYHVATDSDRVAVRLRGPVLTAPAGHVELPSEGLVTGAVQVPASGQPLVFLADRPTTGGYPVVAVVDAQDLAGCAQLRPGDPVRFTLGDQGVRLGGAQGRRH